MGEGDDWHGHRIPYHFGGGGGVSAVPGIQIVEIRIETGRLT